MYFAVLSFEFVIVAIALSAVSLIWYGVPAWREGLNRWIIKLFSWRVWRPGWGLLVLLIPWIMIATIALVSTVENYPKMTDARDVMRFFMSTLRDATYYAEGYTEEKFNSIRSEMSPEEVRAIVGEPLERSAFRKYQCVLDVPEGNERQEIWLYSLRDERVEEGWWWQRVVVWGEDGKVQKVIRRGW